VRLATSTKTAKLDLAVALGSGVDVFLGNGDGTFRAAILDSTDALANSVVSDDFNQDGIPDLALGASPAVDVLLGKGDGTFNAFISYPAGGSSYTGSGQPIITSDFNRDGSKDILIAYQQTGINTNVFEIFNNPGGNRITFTSTSNPSPFGQTVTLSATVTATESISGRPAPTGTIMFMDSTTLLGTTVGNHSIGAVYKGDSNYKTITSSVLTSSELSTEWGWLQIFDTACATSCTSPMRPLTTEPGGLACWAVFPWFPRLGFRGLASGLLSPPRPLGCRKHFRSCHATCVDQQNLTLYAGTFCSGRSQPLGLASVCRS
jgi:hypothetical protein